MALDVLKYAAGNSASTTYSSSVTGSDTAHPLTSDTNFDAKSGEGMVILGEGTANEEFAYATGKSGASLTIPVANRGLEGTSALAHAAGDSVKGIITAGMWNEVIDAITNVLDKTTGAIKASLSFTTPTLTTPTIRNWDGWEDANETWTYASASTITVPSGAAAKYAVGDRIKWTQTTVKYGVITAVADTLLTVAVNTDYTVANAAITANYYSHSASPIGYPHWFTWTPSYSASGSMTFTTVTTNQAKFNIVGKTLYFQISCNGTTGGTASNSLYVTMPVMNAIDSGSTSYGFTALSRDGAGYLGGICGDQTSSSPHGIYIQKYDASNFGLGTNRGGVGAGFYSIA